MLLDSIDTIKSDYSDLDMGNNKELTTSNNIVILNETSQYILKQISKPNKNALETSTLDLESISSLDESNFLNPIKSLEDDFENFYNNFINIIVSTSEHDIYESGMISNTSTEILAFFNKNPQFTKKCVQKVFLDMFDNSQLLIGILDGISCIEYTLAKDEFPIAAIAALSHEDDEVVEYGIRCFENWRNINSLKTLRKLKCREEWMNMYVKKIIEEIEKELN